MIEPAILTATKEYKVTPSPTFFPDFSFKCLWLYVSILTKSELSLPLGNRHLCRCLQLMF